MADALKLNVWDGSKWVPVAVGGGAAATDLHIVSSVEPPPASEIGALWINPDETGVPVLAAFDSASPISYTSPEVTAQSNGQVIGVTADGMYFFQPDIVAAIPIVVNGKKYLLPLCAE